MSHIGKAITLLFWLTAIYNSMMPLEEPVGAILEWVAPLVLVIHCIEVLFCTRRFAVLGRKLAVTDCIQIMVFGGFHLMCLLRKEHAAQRYSCE